MNTEIKPTDDEIYISPSGERLSICIKGERKLYTRDDAVQSIIDNVLKERENKTQSNAGNWVKAGEVDKIEFGDYISVEQKRFGCENEFYTHKVIGTLKSNTWMDVPAITHAGMTQHNEMEEVVNCICMGVSEDTVIRYRVKDIHSVRKNVAAQQPIKSDAVGEALISHCVKLIKQWHNMQAFTSQLPEDETKEIWEIYYKHSPEMKPIREWQAKQQPINKVNDVEDKELKCEGSCEEHNGIVRKVKVIGLGFEDGMDFNYCEEAIKEDLRRGFLVEIL